jgi:outer membrane protein TolC
MRSLDFSAALLGGAFGFDGIRAMRESAARAVELEHDPMSRWYGLAQTALGFSRFLSGEPGAAEPLRKAIMSEASIPLARIMALSVASLVATDEGRIAQARELASAAGRLSDDGDLSSKAVRNALLPTLDAFAYYGGSGVGGNLAVPACTTTLTSECYSALPPPFANSKTVGYGGTLNQLVNSTAPDKGVGLTLSIPLRNREAQANQVRAELEYRQAQVRLHQLENQVRIEVRNAQFDVKQNRASVQAAQYAVDFARQTLDADQQKLKVGLTTTTAILQDASVLTTSASNLVSAKAAYEKSRVELDRATGLLLDHSGIDVADATRGQVTHLPKVPYVIPRQEAPAGGQAAPGGQL